MLPDSVPVQPNHLSLVSYDHNRYSVPVEHAHEQLVLHTFPQQIEIALGKETLAVHRRCWDREQDTLDPQHYLSLLARRPRRLSSVRNPPESLASTTDGQPCSTAIGKR